MSSALRRGEHSGHEDFELGDGGGALTDKLIALVLEGVKTATTSLMAEWEWDGRALPEPGSRWALIDGAGCEHGVVQTREIRVMRLAEVDDAFAREEGEGDENAVQWRAGHERFWAGAYPQLELSDDTLVVCERFELVDRFD